MAISAPPPPGLLLLLLFLLLSSTRTSGAMPPAPLSTLLSSQCTTSTAAGYDLYGGDIQPLGAGFRNATSVAHCCDQCARLANCRFFAYQARHLVRQQPRQQQGQYHHQQQRSRHLYSSVGPPHNCWLKSSQGKLMRNRNRISGAAPGGTLPPPPPSPSPPPPPPPSPPTPPPDACFGSFFPSYYSSSSSSPAINPWPNATWCNTSLSFSERVSHLIAALTLPEKIAQISTYTPSTVPGVPRVGLPPFSYHSEGLHGLRDARETLGLNATMLPQTTGLAAAGNISLIRAMGRMMLAEARALNNIAQQRQLNAVYGKGAGLFYWSPTMNVGRDPRWGRFQESISEDPYLNGRYSAALVAAFQGLEEEGDMVLESGIRSSSNSSTTTTSSSSSAVANNANAFTSSSNNNSDVIIAQSIRHRRLHSPSSPAPSRKYLGVAATCKHFAAYSLESADGYTRHTFNAVVSPRDLNETYLPGFKACVTGGQPAQIMCSYNAINGVPACLHGDLMNGLVRTQWGFDGLIVSDQDAVSDAAFTHKYASAPKAVGLAVRAGCDQNDGKTYAQYGQAAVAEGDLDESDVDTALRRILMQRFRVGAFDPPALNPYREIGAEVLDSPTHRRLAREAARQAVVLLENRGSVAATEAEEEKMYMQGMTSTAALLPFPPTANLSYAVIGPMANSSSALKGGKNDYDPSFISTIWAGLSTRANAYNQSASLEPGSGVKSPLTDGVDRACALAAAADITVLVLGIDGTCEHEGMDRTSIGLPAAQMTLLQKVALAAAAAAQKQRRRRRVVVVLVNGGPLSIDWLRNASTHADGPVDAVVEAFEGGQAAGEALADVLWGQEGGPGGQETGPGGVLPFTLYPEDYVSAVKMSDMGMHPNASTGNPGRTYRFYTGTPLWPFGAGKTYTQWSLEWEEENTTKDFWGCRGGSSSSSSSSTVHCWTPKFDSKPSATNNNNNNRIAAAEATVPKHAISTTRSSRRVPSMELHMTTDSATAGDGLLLPPLRVRISNVGARLGDTVLMAFVSANPYNYYSDYGPASPSPPAGDGNNNHETDDHYGLGTQPLQSLWYQQRVHLVSNTSATLSLLPAAGDAVAAGTRVGTAGWCALCTVDNSGRRAVRPGTYTIRIGGHGGKGGGCGSGSSSSGSDGNYTDNDASPPCLIARVHLTGTPVDVPL